MGVTGASGFPCCGKESVDIVDTQGSKNQPQFQLVQEEDEIKLEKELLELEPPHKVGLDLEPELELEVEPKAEDSEQLKYRIESLQPDTQSDMQPDTQPDTLPDPQPDTQPDTLPDPQPDTQPDTLPDPQPDTQPDTQPDISQWSIRPNSSYLSSAEEDQVSTNHRSICVQTSKHLFWADKLIQASEHSLERMTDTQLGKNKGKTISHLGQQSVPKDTTCSKKQLQTPSAQPAPPATDSQQLPNPYPSSSSLSPAIGLEELVNFASSLAVASSSKMDLPNLEHMIKAPPQKAEVPSTDPTTQVAVDQPEKKKLTKELPDRPPLKARESQKAQKPQDKNFSHPYLDFSKPGIKRATIKGEVKLLQPPAMSPLPQGDMKEQPKAEDQEIPVIGTGSIQVSRAGQGSAGTSFCLQNPLDKGLPPQQPRRLPTQDPGEEQPCRMQKGRPQQPTALPAQREPASIVATGAEQCSQRARGFKHLAATSSVKSGSGAGSQSSSADENLLPLTARLLAAFQEIFKLFSSSPTGTVDMRSMKAALRNVGIQLSPQEMCEALQQADLDGDGTVSFKDFLGVLTDSHRLAQCLGQVRNSRFYDPQGLQTLFLEMLFKLMSQGFLPHKVVQEVMSYYTKKQRALRLNPGWKGRARGPSGAVRAHASLTFFCQAARLGGLSGAELERSLHRLHKAGARSPYSQIPNLAGRTPPEDRTRNRAPLPDLRLPKSCQPSRHKLGSTQRALSLEFVGQPLGSLRRWKMAPSPPTLVQQQPFSPSPACLPKPAMKNVYK